MKFGIQVTPNGSTLTLKAESDFDKMVLKQFQKSDTSESDTLQVRGTISARDYQKTPVSVTLEFPSHD